MNETFSLPRLGKIQLLGLFLIWLISGMLGGPLAYLVIPVFVFLMGNKRMHLALFLGFFLILILSDNRLQSLEFAENLRPVYILFLVAFIAADNRLRPLDKMYKFFIPFFVVALLCLFNSNIVITGFLKTVSYLLIIIVVPTYLNSIYEDYADEALKYIVYLGIFTLSVGIIFWAARSNLVFIGGRYRGMLGNPNGLGIFCMLFFFLFVVIKTYKPTLFSRRQIIVFYLIIIGSVLLCRSRSALGGILIFLFFRQFYKISKAFAFLILICIIIFYQVLLAYIPVIISALDLQNYARLKTLQGGSGRLIAYRFAWQHIKQSLWIGHGMGYTDILFSKSRYILSPLGHQGNSHNSYLTIWLNTGFFGLICFIGAWLLNFWRASMRSYLAYPILFAVLFSAFVEEWLAASLNAFTIVLLMIVTLLTNSKFINEQS